MSICCCALAVHRINYKCDWTSVHTDTDARGTVWSEALGALVGTTVCAHQPAFITALSGRWCWLRLGGQVSLLLPHGRPIYYSQSWEKSGRKIRNHRPTELGSIDCTFPFRSTPWLPPAWLPRPLDSVWWIPSLSPMLQNIYIQWNQLLAQLLQAVDVPCVVSCRSKMGATTGCWDGCKRRCCRLGETDTRVAVRVRYGRPVSFHPPPDVIKHFTLRCDFSRVTLP